MKGQEGDDSSRGIPSPASWYFRSPQYLKGIGPERAQELKEHGIETIYDLLYNLPRSYRDLRGEGGLFSAPHGAELLVEYRVVNPPRRMRGRIWKSSGISEGAPVELYWFSEELPGPARGLNPGDKVWLIGRVDRRHRQIRFSHPRILKERPRQRLEPVYRGLPWLSRVMPRFVVEHEALLRTLDPVPHPVREELGLLPLSEALRTVHAPGEEEDLGDLNQFQGKAFERIAMDQFLLYFLAMEIRRRSRVSLPATPVLPDREKLKKIAELLPFALHEEQRQVLREILEDMRKSTPMFRLVQGEVGSGKTVIAVIALAAAVLSGGQGALLAPTEILAHQHLRFVDSLLPGLGIRTALLTGSVTGRRREEVLEGIRKGVIELLVGTHALLEEGVEFRDLRLVVIDEEQRFGVLQRAILKQKGNAPHTLYLTATPIPRSLLLTLLGELQVSQLLKRAKPGAKITTVLVPPSRKREVLRHIQNALREKERVYFLYPRIETGDPRYRSVTEMYERLCKFFGEDQVVLLHGRLKDEEKLKAMEDFRQGRKPIMVATSVIEVGVDVPEATIMVIGHPELFGLSQLHQLRGRIGRGGKDSYCYLLLEDQLPEESLQRLELFARCEDGFAIAEADFEIRGSGTIFGTRQSGMPDLPPELFTRYQESARTARALAQRLIEKDPQLLLPEHRLLRELLLHRWLDKPELILA